MMMSHSLGHSIPEMWPPRHPPAGTTVNLHIALKPHREDALIQRTLRGQPSRASEVHPRPFVLPCSYSYMHMVPAETPPTYPKTKFPSSSCIIGTLSNPSASGSHTRRSAPLWSQSSMATVGYTV